MDLDLWVVFSHRLFRIVLVFICKDKDRKAFCYLWLTEGEVLRHN